MFRNESGKEYTRTEIVRKPLVVETYVRLRQTKVRDAFALMTSLERHLTLFSHLRHASRDGFLTNWLFVALACH